MSDLYLVATPIGNLEDMSFRAVRILKEVPLIAAEDTRTSSKLLKNYKIDTPLTSYHDHNKAAKTEVLINHLNEADLALVSDAGTPAINDPGFILVQAALAAGHRVVPVPGPSAPIAALSAAGLPTDNFLYLGYLPRKKKARQDLLNIVKDLPWTLIFLETPHRLLSALEDCLSILGDRQIAVARELTKLHEEIQRGSINQVWEYYSEKKPKGEITLVIAGRKKEQNWDQKRLLKVIQEEVEAGGVSPSQLAKRLAKESGWSRKDIYNLMQGLQD
jgi:16S rRNA (cytidine1402-2'-O)-methyltransferase